MRRGAARVLGVLLVAAGWTLAAAAQPAAPLPSKPAVEIAVLQLGAAPPSDRASALRDLLGAVARRTAVETTTSAPAVVRPKDPALFDHPLVFLLGGEPFGPLADDEVDALRSYVSLGGMVVIDDQSGDRQSPFAVRAREQMSRILGGRQFVKLRTDHALFKAYYLLDRAWGRLDAVPDIEALVLDGRAAVVYSGNDAAGAWQRDEFGNWARDVRPGGSEQREMAVRFGVNLVVYALTLNYKEDLVHLPLITQRRR